MDTTAPTAGRRAASREASRERRRRAPPGVSQSPAGPQTTADWNEIVDGLREKFSRLEKATQSHAHSLGQLLSVQSEFSQVNPSIIKKLESL